MAYSTYIDIQKLISAETLLQLCDDDDVGSIVVSPPNTAYNNIVEAIEQADAIIDSYLDSRYVVPITVAIPVQVKNASANLALCHLYDRRRELDVPEGIERRRKQWTDWLKQVQARKASVPGLAEETADRGYSVSKTEDDRVFTSDLLNKY